MSEPVIVNPSAVPVVAGVVTRDILIVVAALPILVKLVGARDLTAILQWLQSSDGATFLAIVVPVLVSAWRTTLSLRRKREIVEIGMNPDNKGVIVGPALPPPAVTDVEP